jgi:hypothetical protein
MPNTTALQGILMILLIYIPVTADLLFEFRLVDSDSLQNPYLILVFLKIWWFSMRLLVNIIHYQKAIYHWCHWKGNHLWERLDALPNKNFYSRCKQCCLWVLLKIFRHEKNIILMNFMLWCGLMLMLSCEHHRFLTYYSTLDWWTGFIGSQHCFLLDLSFFYIVESCILLHGAYLVRDYRKEFEITNELSICMVCHLVTCTAFVWPG